MLKSLVQRVLARIRPAISCGAWMLLVRHHGSTIRIGAIEINARMRLVRRRGSPVHLSPKVFDLLLALVKRQGAVASRLELMQEVWGHRAAVMSRTVDAHIAELRRKLEDDTSNPRLVITVWKRGYRIDPEATS